MFERSPLARFGTQAVLLVVAVPVALKASAVVERGLKVLAVFLVVALAVVTPLLLDMWAQVRADRHGISWRNRMVRHRLEWSEVAGFGRGSSSMVLHRTNGKRVPLRALGLRYFGSKKLASQRIAVLERLRRG